jgi:poly(3-hydroxybutyrate) depolymerase
VIRLLLVVLAGAAVSSCGPVRRLGEASSPAASPVGQTRAPLATVAPEPASGTSARHLPDGRTFLLHVGPQPHGPQPLIVALHMAAHSAAQMESTGLSAFADEHHFIVAYGQGIGGYWNAGGCCGNDKADDVAYLRDVVATVAASVDIDRSRVYVVGMSNGAMMAYRAACEAPQVFAAAGVVAGALMPGVHCGDTTIRVMQIHGTHDTTVPLTGGPGYEGIEFPAQATTSSRVGPGSTIQLRVWDGSHQYPSWANALLWSALSKYRLKPTSRTR